MTNPLTDEQIEAGRRAIVAVNSWAGRFEYAVSVIGETPKRYRVRWIDGWHSSRWRSFAAGDVTLVPKYAVRFTPELDRCVLAGCERMRGEHGVFDFDHDFAGVEINADERTKV